MRSALSPEQIQRARSLREDEHLGYGTIAQRFGVSRNTIVGLANRQGWKTPAAVVFEQRRGADAKRPSTYATTKVWKPAKAKKPARVAPVRAVIDWRRIADMGPRVCQWIEADPRVDPTPCGAEQVVGTPYCAGHCARAYVQPVDVSSPFHAATMQGGADAVTRNLSSHAGASL